MADKWSKPTDVSKMSDFSRIEPLMPTMEEIPREFHKDSHPWCEWQSKWFFNGLTKEQIPTPKEGIDVLQAIKHLAMIQRSLSLLTVYSKPERRSL